MKMLRFEIKKVFSKTKNRITIIVLLVILIATSILTINRVEYVDESGNHLTGISAAKNLREAKNEWSGYLTEDVFQNVLEENRSINNEASSDSIEEENKRFAKKQGISTIRDVINYAFSEYRDYNDFAIDNISDDEASTVYERRISTLKEYLDSGEETFTEKEKSFLIQQYENLDTPFYYEYMDGWSALLQNISTFMLILALVIGFFVSGIFSDEFQTKADSIFFSTRLGRNKGVLSKIGAGLTIVSAFYAAFVFLYTFIVLSVLGTDGANCPIQLDLWRSAYNVTFLQAYLLIVAGGLALAGLGIIFYLLLRRQALIESVGTFFVRILRMIHCGRLADKLEKKLEVSIEKYSSLVDVIFDGKRMLWKVYILNLLQRLSQIIVTLFSFAALHGDLRKLPQLLATQIYVVMGSNCVPIPGGMGVTDYLMLKGYQQLMSREAAFQLEMLSRGLSFYVCIFVSLTAVLIGYVTIKRKKKLENENDRIL